MHPPILVGLGVGVGEGLGLGVGFGLGNQVAISMRGCIIWQGCRFRHNNGTQDCICDIGMAPFIVFTAIHSVHSVGYSLPVSGNSHP